MRGKFEVLGRRQGQARQWRRWLWFHVGYETSPSAVIQAVELAVCHADIPNVARVPAPNCVMMDFEHLAGRYALRYWLTDLSVSQLVISERKANAARNKLDSHLDRLVSYDAECPSWFKCRCSSLFTGC